MDADVAGERKVAVIIQTLARTLDLADSALGATIALHVLKTPMLYEVVGVLKDAPNQGMRLPVQAAIHVPLTTFLASGQLVVRTYGPAAGLAGALRRPVC